MTESFSVQRRAGGFEEALANGQLLLAQHPSAALQQAETLFLLKRDARVCRLAAEACRRLGRDGDAERAELSAIEASLDEPDLRKATEAKADGRVEESLAIARAFLQQNPDDLLALVIASEALLSLWKLDESEELSRFVLKRAPDFTRASTLLATCLAKQIRVKDAITVLADVVERRPDHAPSLSYLAQLCSEVRDNERAVILYERLVSLDQERAERWVNLGQHYRIIGRRDDAIGAFRQALALDQANGSAWWTLANYFPQELTQSDELAILASLGERCGEQHQSALHLALGLLADRRGDRLTAFDHFLAGKQIRQDRLGYHPDAISAAVDGVISLMTPEFYANRRSVGCNDRSPIFILGMPRSGTTMVERMLGRTDFIEGTGELQLMPRLAEVARRQAEDPEHYAALLKSLSGAQLEWVGKRYVDASLDYRRTDKPSFIDKANLNWMQIGLILLALPNAMIIDVRREALDCCWANFKMLFADGYPAANHLRHIGRLYRDYVRLMDAMAIAAPGRILPVRYEDIVDDIEGQTRRILGFLGFDYDPRCLDFHLSSGAVATASSEQVRRPLNREGIGSADPYRPWLGPLIDELGQAA